jgi:hypothetical protein
MEKTAINIASIAKKAIKYSLTIFWIPAHLANKQSGISKVVNKIKNKEIPSIPKTKLIFKKWSHW